VFRTTAYTRTSVRYFLAVTYDGALLLAADQLPLMTCANWHKWSTGKGTKQSILASNAGGVGENRDFGRISGYRSMAAGASGINN